MALLEMLWSFLSVICGGIVLQIQIALGYKENTAALTQHLIATQ